MRGRISIASLAGGATATVQLVARMIAVTPGQQILNSAVVVAGVLDPVPANNIGTATVSVPTLEPSGDADGDGLTNDFETTYGLNPFGAARHRAPTTIPTRTAAPTSRSSTTARIRAGS